MSMVNISDKTKDRLNDLVHDFKKSYPDFKITQDYVIYKALTKLEGDYQ